MSHNSTDCLAAEQLHRDLADTVRRRLAEEQGTASESHRLLDIVREALGEWYPERKARDPVTVQIDTERARIVLGLCDTSLEKLRALANIQQSMTDDNPDS